MKTKESCTGQSLYMTHQMLVGGLLMYSAAEITEWNISCHYQGSISHKQGKSEGFESCDWPIVQKCPIWVKIGDVLSRVTLKFDG